MTSPLNDRETLARRDNAATAALLICLVGSMLAAVCAYAALARDLSAPGTPPTPQLGLATTDRVHVPGGRLVISSNDWEALGKVTPRDELVREFFIDRYEATYTDWSSCGLCAPQPRPSDPRLPVTNVSPSDAAAFCRHRGGRLPTHSEWMFAASSGQGNRYPWGQTGLVCRKAVFGAVDGPCERGGRALPVGSRPLGATPLGIHDLCGNVAEWVTDGSSSFAAGGSFRSTLAGQLKVWSREETNLPRDDIGVRCAYAL